MAYQRTFYQMELKQANTITIIKTSMNVIVADIITLQLPIGGKRPKEFHAELLIRSHQGKDFMNSQNTPNHQSKDHIRIETISSKSTVI